MSDQNDDEGIGKCCHCGLPIHRSENGVRHYGDRIAHSENRCYWLLRERVSQAKGLLRETQAEIGQQCSVIYNSYVDQRYGEVVDPEMKAELEKLDSLFRRVDAFLQGN